MCDSAQPSQCLFDCLLPPLLPTGPLDAFRCIYLTNTYVTISSFFSRPPTRGSRYERYLYFIPCNLRSRRLSRFVLVSPTTSSSSYATSLQTTRRSVVWPMGILRKNGGNKTMGTGQWEDSLSHLESPKPRPATVESSYEESPCGPVSSVYF